MRSCLILLALAAGLALAGPVAAHEWYGGLERNDGGGSCCNDEDCRPVAMCQMEGGAEGLMIEGTCRPIEWDKVLAIPSPDGQAHACYTSSFGLNGMGLQFLCIILGGSA